MLRIYLTVWPCDLAPDDTDLGATDLLLAPVHVCDPLAEVEVGGLGVIDALDLDEGGAWAEGVLATLEGNVLALDITNKPGVLVQSLAIFPKASHVCTVRADRCLSFMIGNAGVGESRVQSVAVVVRSRLAGSRRDHVGGIGRVVKVRCEGVVGRVVWCRRRCQPGLGLPRCCGHCRIVCLGAHGPLWVNPVSPVQSPSSLPL